MRNRRLAIIAALSIVELWIVGLMIRSVSCGTTRDSSFAAAANAAGATSAERTIATGPAPRVVIDDDAARLTVSVREGATVSVTERVHAGGWGPRRAAARPVTIEKTGDGVRIARPDGVAIAGFSATRQLDVVVPPGATLDVENAGATTVSGLRGEATLHTDDGAVAVSDHRGALTVTTDNGTIDLTDVEAPALEVTTDNGRITLSRVRSDAANVTTDNGRIDVARSLLRGGKIKTDSGRIRLGLDPQSNVTVSAQTSSGNVLAQAPLTVTGGTDDDSPSLIRVGSGAGQLDVASDDGSITVFAGGA